jgi:hypothetical protein
MKFKTLVIFYIILFVAWTVTEPQKPKEEPPPKIVRRKMPKEKPYNFPQEYAWIHNGLEDIFGKVSSSFSGKNIPVLVLPVFTMSTGDTATLPAYMTESAYAYLSNSRNIRTVKRDYKKSKSRIKSKYVLIGRLTPIGDQIRVSVRVEDIYTGEIIDVFDAYIDRNKAGFFL